MNFTHDSGDIGDGTSILIREVAGNEVKWTDGDAVRFGDYVHIDGSGSGGALKRICSAGQTYSVIQTTESGEAYVILEYEIPEDPDPIPPAC